MERILSETLFALLLLTASTLAVAAPGSEPARRTKVIVFQPSIPTEQARSGDCQTNSIAVSRPGVWRCIADNEIYDQCFENSKLRGSVICDSNPARGTTGFILRLNKPLPAPSKSSVADSLPWLMKLADGSICERETGTISSVNGEDVPYDCSDSKKGRDDGKCPYLTGLAANIKGGDIWRVDKIAYSVFGGQTTVLKHQHLMVESVWK